MKRLRTSEFFEEYAKHSTLNLGQALQGIRYFYSHPDIDAKAQVGSSKHFVLSLILRSKRVTNDLFYAAIPPHWHHSAEELRGICKVPLLSWFQYGYCAWRFTDSGELKTDLSQVDRRWDPRCK